MPVRDWFEQRSFHRQDFSDLASSGEAMRRPAITLILPAREVAGTIGPILDTVTRLNERSGLVDQVLVVDADSADGTADIARPRGAEVYSENELLPEYGPAQGKGDAMWRALRWRAAISSCSPTPIRVISVSILSTARSARC